MTEDQKRLLAVFEVRVRDLMELCNKQNHKINELTTVLNHKETELKQAIKTIEELNTKCDKLLTARVVSVNEGEMKSARMRLSKLVREVDKCIHLEIAEKSYGLWIDRGEEQLARDAAKQIRNKINQYRQYFAKSDVDVKDLLAMVAFQLSMSNLQLEDKNDTSPITDKIQDLTGELEKYLKDK